MRLLEQELARQTALLHARQHFTAQVSQELRTPLNGIVGMSQLLIGTPLNEEQEEIVQMLAQSGEDLLSLVNDILDFSKIESGLLRLESVAFDLGSVVESVFDMVSPAAADKKLHLAYLPAPDLPDRYVGDPTRLRQVLLTLVSNALKFTQEGEVIIYARADLPRGYAPRCRLNLVVQDTGVGIASERLATLFDPYPTADPSLLRRAAGAGLGLVIARQLAMLMQGDLTVDSTLQQGSAFHFSAHLAVSTPARTLPPFQGTGKRVLVAISHRPTLDMISQLLSRAGIAVSAATSVDEALRVLDRGEVDAAFYSANLSDRSGTRLLMRARQHANGAHLPALELHPLGQRPAGTTVLTLTTPVHRDALYQAAGELLRAQPPVSVKADDPISGDGAAGLRILLAEDNPINQMVALRLLESLGYRADVVENGLEAVEAVQRRTYDVVLMDIMMPVMDGLEATRRIRQAPLATSPRIIAVTANALASDRQRCLEAGMDEHIPKPLRMDVLARALRLAGASLTPEVSVSAASSPVDTAPAPENASVLNYGTLRELRESVGDDDEFFDSLVLDFLTDSAELLAQLTGALESNDTATARRAVHTLKSSAAMFGATALSDLCRRAELAAKSSELDSMRTLVEPMRVDFGTVEEAFTLLRTTNYAAL